MNVLTETLEFIKLCGFKLMPDSTTSYECMVAGENYYCHTDVDVWGNLTIDSLIESANEGWCIDIYHLFVQTKRKLVITEVLLDLQNEYN